MRGICRIFDVSRPTLAKWVKKALLNPGLEDTLSLSACHDLLELDEVWSFVKRRSNKCWLWIALCRRIRQAVIGDRSEKSRQLVWRTIPEGY